MEAAGLDPRCLELLTLGWMVERQEWFENDIAGERRRTTMAGYGLSAAIAAGRVAPLPVRLSKVPSMIVADPPELAVVSGVRSSDGVRFSSSVGCGDVLARHAARVVVEIDDTGVDLGGPVVEGNIVATVDRPTGARSIATARPADEVDRVIGGFVASLLPDQPTLQFGPGGVGEAIADAVDRPVRVVSGLVTDAMALLHQRGLLLDPIVATYAWGGAPIRELAASGMLAMKSAAVTNDPGRLAAIDRFVGCNTAIQIGLDGSVNVERVGSRVITGIGGHADFCAGASRSVGGCSIIATRATTSSGTSTIVPQVDVVSTQRSEVDVCVTEYGIADLRGASDSERAERLIAIAAPQHRSQLTAATAQV